MSTSARRLWSAAEVLHAVTYFHPTALAAVSEAGARGFWMGYFAARLGPLGPVGPAVGTAVCFNFSPARVARALPDAWSYVAPSAAVQARTTGAAAALTACGVPDPAPELLEQRRHGFQRGARRERTGQHLVDVVGEVEQHRKRLRGVEVLVHDLQELRPVLRKIDRAGGPRGGSPL